MTARLSTLKSSLRQGYGCRQTQTPGRGVGSQVIT